MRLHLHYSAQVLTFGFSFVLVILSVLLPSTIGALAQELSTESNMASPTIPLNPEAYEKAPPNLVLDQVHVYVRHGALFVTCHL